MSNRGPRQDANNIFRAALTAANPAGAVLRHLTMDGSELVADDKRYSLARPRHVYLIGAGKASAAMAQGVEQLLGDRIAGGLISVKYGHGARLRHVEINECSHPVPDENGRQGAERIAQIARTAEDGDLVICLISGGASALLPLPAPPVTLEDKQHLTQLLLDCGANIHEINCLRKHLSLVKGGRLARLASPAKVLTLILSDVIGDDLDTIGSGPTVPDNSTFADAAAILTKYNLWARAPQTVVEHIREAKEETPKPGNQIFHRVQNLIVGSNRLAVDAAALRASALGYRPLILSTSIQGETRDVARMHAAIAREALASGHPVRPPACIISGGETTVTLRGKGLGGRNQEFALAAAIDIDGLKRVTILSGGTDGSDGPTDAAGGIVNGNTVARGRALGLNAAEFLEDNNAYRFLESTGDLLKTGPTKTNVMDVRLILLGPPSEASS